MDPGTALAVISLAVQLIGTVQSISEYLRTIHDTPSELFALIETLDQIQSNLNQVHYLIEQQFSNRCLPGSPVFILNALRTCERRVKTLENLVDEIRESLGDRHLMKRTWASLNMRMKKARIQELQSQLNDSMSGLQFAVSNNIWQLQLNQVPMAISQQMVVKKQVHTPIFSDQVKQQCAVLDIYQNRERTFDFGLSNPALPMSTRLVNTTWYQGFLGSVVMREKSLSVKTLSSRSVRKSLLTEKVMALKIWLLKSEVEIYFGTSLTSVPRALKVYQLVEFDSFIWDMCRNSDLEGFQAAFTNGRLSPFVIDQSGQTLLYLASILSRPALCSFFLRLGLDPDRVITSKDPTQSLRKALTSGLLSTPDDYYQDHLDTCRILAQSQQEISRTDVSQFFEALSGPVGLADWMLSQYAVQYELSHTEQEEVIYHPLGTALRGYGEQYKDKEEWESFIRRLIRMRVDIHAPMPRHYHFDPQEYPCALSPYGTPLDELFTHVHTSWDAKVVADAWLRILSSEGYNVLAYLENEKALHATQLPLTCHYRCYGKVPMQLIFDLGEDPSVYAEPWIDPESSTSIIREELKNSNILGNCDCIPGVLFPEWCWPLIYPKWSDNMNYPAAALTAKQREERRWQKKVIKAARRNSTLVSSKMPGAWPGK